MSKTKYSSEAQEWGSAGAGAPSKVSSRWAIESIPGKIGCSSQPLYNWVRQAERDAGSVGG
ncbi:MULTISPECIES: hypothetical protein [Xanthomonas]|uniref:hypothetical protein n=1 Tax=Xanthomonas TaxID=338 RepID=UPI0012FE462A|nr:MULTISPECIES: hypothetical protein [Xanthomonas]MBV6862348.1 hypothetical protein [Xanthomonas campestris pv. blepharidis]